MNTEISEQLDYIQMILESAKEWGLEAKVILWALQTIKDNPAISIEDAIAFGYNECVK
jgi:hypothetical protein